MTESSTESAARLMAIAILGVDIACRKCGAPFSPAASRSFFSGKRVKCSKRCGWYGTWRDGTILNGARISNNQFISLFFRYTVPTEINQISEHLNISTDTVKFWRDRIIGASLG